MFDRKSPVNVTLKIRTKFHGSRLVRFRDILRTVCKNLVSRKTRLKFQTVIFHMYPLLTFFTYIYRGSQLQLQFTTKLNPSPLIFDSPKVIFESHALHFVILLKVANSDTNSIILYPRIYHYTPRISRFQRLGPFLSYFQDFGLLFKTIKNFFENFTLSWPLKIHIEFSKRPHSDDDRARSSAAVSRGLGHLNWKTFRKDDQSPYRWQKSIIRMESLGLAMHFIWIVRW